MKRSFKILLNPFTAALIALPALADTQKEHHESNLQVDAASGDFKRDAKSEKTDVTGTETVNEYKEESKVDSSGAKTTSIVTKSATDPEGIMNKTKSASKVWSKEDPSGDFKRSTTAAGVDATGTAYKTNSEVKVDAHSDGTSKITAKAVTVKDPKGLMNKSTAEIDTTVVKDKYGNAQIVTEKKVDGETVSTKTSVE